MIIVEDGSGLPNAQSYVSTSDVTAYFTLRGNTTYVPTDAQIIKAMDYVEAIYSTQFIDTKLLSTQALSFPRVVDGVTIYPIALKNAVCELAFKASTAELMIDSDQRTIKESVGSITVEYDKSSSQLTQYNAVYNLLKPYLFGSQYSAKVIRV